MTGDRLTALEDAIAAGLRALPDWRGKALLALGYMKARERRGPLDGTWHVHLTDGSALSLPRGSSMSWSVAATGQWDRHIVELVRRFVAPRTVVLDVGASLGLWAIPLGRIALEQGGRLECFEPNPENLSWLQSNIVANGLDDLTKVHPVAVGAAPGTAQLGFRECGGGNGAITLDGDRGVPVTVVRLDDYAFAHPVSFVKMDVEGFELEVLRGMRAVLKRDRPVILGEFNATWLRERREDLSAHLQEVAALGYEVFALEQRRSSRWRANDIAALRRLAPPFAGVPEDLLLIPSGPLSGS